MFYYEGKARKELKKEKSPQESNPRPLILRDKCSTAALQPCPLHQRVLKQAPRGGASLSDIKVKTYLYSNSWLAELCCLGHSLNNGVQDSFPVTRILTAAH